MFSNTLFQKISTCPWAQFSTPHLTPQLNVMRHVFFFFLNCGNPAKPRSRINPEDVCFFFLSGMEDRLQLLLQSIPRQNPYVYSTWCITRNLQIAWPLSSWLKSKDPFIPEQKITYSFVTFIGIKCSCLKGRKPSLVQAHRMVPETATSPSRRATENSEGKRSPKASFFF